MTPGEKRELLFLEFIYKTPVKDSNSLSDVTSTVGNSNGPGLKHFLSNFSLGKRGGAL